MTDEIGMGEGLVEQKPPRDVEMIMAAFLPNLRHLESRFDRIDLNIKDLGIGVKDTNNRLTGLEKRMDYFEVQVDKRFELLTGELKDFKGDVNRRFEQVDKRFDVLAGELKDFKGDVNRRFEQVDKRFENVDRRFDQIAASIERLGDKLDARDTRQRSFTLQMFGIAISISFLGALGVLAKSFGII
jgi:chromosome segregation ATPase